MQVPESVVKAVTSKHHEAPVKEHRDHAPALAGNKPPLGIDQDSKGVSMSLFNSMLDKWAKESTAGVRISITPLMASLMLERNRSDEWHNRPMHNLAVERYTRFMRTGRWAYTGEPIIFSTEGELLNGQTRLTALIRAGITTKMLLVFGVDRDAFQYMDTGARRSASDTFAIEDIPNSKHAAAVSKLLYNYDHDESWGGEANGSNTRVENDELLEFYRKHEDIQDSIKIGRIVTAEGNGLIVPSWAAFLHYACARIDAARADVFYRKLLSGIGIETEHDMAGVARRKLLQLTNDHARSGGVTQSYRAAIVAIAWNAESNHRPLKKLGWRMKNLREPFPRVK